MEESSKEKIKQVLAERKEKGDALYREMVSEIDENKTITIENLYSQLQSLKHEIDIEVIQQKLKTYDDLSKLIDENEDTLKEMIKWFKAQKQKGAIS